MNSVKGGA